MRRWPGSTRPGWARPPCGACPSRRATTTWQWSTTLPTLPPSRRSASPVVASSTPTHRPHPGRRSRPGAAPVPCSVRSARCGTVSATSPSPPADHPVTMPCAIGRWDSACSTTLPSAPPSWRSTASELPSSTGTSTTATARRTCSTTTPVCSMCRPTSRPCIPGTGQLRETGAGDGTGSTLNLPFPAGTAGDTYRAAFDDVVVPVVEQFAPDWLIISAGFDAHRNDPLAGLCLTSADFADMAKRLQALVPDRARDRRARRRLRPGGDDVRRRRHIERARRRVVPARAGVDGSHRAADRHRRQAALGSVSVRRSGDGFLRCSDGHVRWGVYGAAGVVFVVRFPEGPRVMLQKRSALAHEGGTWSCAGGALDEAEEPLTGAAARSIGGDRQHPR